MPPRTPRPDFRNPQLGDALQTRDMAAMAFALRHGATVVPLLDSSSGAALPEMGASTAEGEVWIHRDPATGDRALLVFSDAAHLPKALPNAVALLSPAALEALLDANADTLTTVLLDLAGPHPMRAAPADVLAALRA